jgi:ribosomal protein S18 acetylase RimI-like enzyme
MVEPMRDKTTSSRVRLVKGNDSGATSRILASLPQWFGIPAANEHYVKAAAGMPSYVAVVDDEVVGVLLVPRHFSRAAEVYLIAVDAAFRNQGIGRALLEAAEADLRDEGVTLLQVKTLGPSRPSSSYQETRRFYEQCGFQPLEEIHGLWKENPCLVMVKTL